MAKLTNQERVAIQAQRVLNDTRWDFIRTPAARRGLAVFAYLAVIFNSAMYLLNTYIGLIGLAVLFGAYLLLRISIRSVADLPDEYLDERLRSIRSVTYYRSYLLVVGLLTVAAVLLMGILIASDIATDGSSALHFSLDWNTSQAIIWFILGVTMMTPSAVLAFTQADKIH